MNVFDVLIIINYFRVIIISIFNIASKNAPLNRPKANLSKLYFINIIVEYSTIISFRSAKKTGKLI